MRSPSFWGKLFGNGAARSAAETVGLFRALLSERGEASGRALAQQALAAYESLDEDARVSLFDTLAAAFSPAPEEVAKAADAYKADPGPRTLAKLQQVVEPSRQELFRRLNMAPGGTAALVGMRNWLLEHLPRHPAWEAIDADMLHLLRSWFNRGFLVLERIDWRTSAIVLEKLIRYESVHAIAGWPDLHRRLEGDRRCFAFFHPSLPEEPLIFIEVAFTRGISSQVQPLIDADSEVRDPQEANTAIFYSISNCQAGLRGVSFGNFLIKQVVEELRREHPQLKTFSTLSPIPGFRRWLDALPKGALPGAVAETLAKPDWYAAPSRALREAEEQLTRFCAHYLINVKRKADPVDAVARFHLGNGACLERINWLGDRSQQGIASSAGLMVNYVYRIADIERNHERYAREHKVVAAGNVEKLARECPLAVENARVAREQQRARESAAAKR
jgi:malonyl-CoA decarboxylase